VLRSAEEHGIGCGFRPSVDPSVPCSTLYDGVSGRQNYGNFLVELESQFPFEDYLEVDRGSRVHPSAAALVKVKEAWECSVECIQFPAPF
jgi:hypothetical protein